MQINNLRINGLESPEGYKYGYISISWLVEDSASSAAKESTVRIALDPDMKNIVSEKKGALDSAGTEMDIELSPRTDYYVQVEVTDDSGELAKSEITHFSTGKMDEPWEAKWIGLPKGCEYHPILSKSFNTEKEIRTAKLYVTGVGLYEAYINGQKAGDGILAPFFNDYRYGIQIQTIDVTGLLKAGLENTIEIMLGNGWYKGHLGYNGKSEIFGDQFAAIAELHIEYDDGKEAVVATDSDWNARPSDITMSDIYDGESCDRLKYKDERKAEPVVLVNMDGKTLTDRYSAPLRVMEEIEVKEIIHTPSGETVLDFGQNFSGFVSFNTGALKSGDAITLEHGEVLQKGNFYHDNYRAAKTLISYTSDGRDEWYAPRFTYMGFRYVKVSGWPGEIDKDDFKGKVVYSAMERTGFLESGNEKVNKLISNALWGQKSNFLDMPTDCPQRNERLGWTGDAQVFAPTASFFMNTKAFYRKFLWDMRCDQIKRDGSIANSLPNIDDTPGGAAVWADAATFIPDTLYESFGDKKLLEEVYPLMKDWVDYITRGDEKREGGPQYLFNFAFTFGDWLAMDGVSEQSMKGGTEDAYVASVYYYASVIKTAKAAAILGKKEDKEKLTLLAEKIKEAILEEYFAPSGRLAIDTQTGYIIALHFGIWRDRDKLIKGLKDRLRRDAFRIKCGFTGAPLICETLADNSMMDIAMHIFLQEKFPSWLHCVNLGATTIWERWNSLLDDGTISGTGMNSLNHYAYGSVINFVVRSIAGFTATEPGYRKVRIVPMPDARLKKLDLCYTSVYGKYVANWKILPSGELSFHYEIPFGCTAEVLLPESEKEITLSAGTYDYTISTKKDYRVLYDMHTMLDDLAADEKALKIIEEKLPAASKMIKSGDIESLTMTFFDLATQPWFGCKKEDVDKTVEALKEIKAEL